MSLSNDIADYPTIGDFFDAQVSSVVFNILYDLGAPLANSMHGLLTAAMLFSITIYGIRITLNDTQASSREFVVTLIWGMLSLGVVAPSFYFTYVISLFYDLREFFITILLDQEFSSGQSIFQAVSNSFSKVFLFVGRMFELWSVSMITPLLFGLLIGAFYGIFYAYLVITLMFINVVMGILFVLGVLVIPLGAFQMWRAVVKSWIQALLKYTSVSIFVSVVVLLTSRLMTISLWQLSQDTMSVNGTYSNVSFFSSGMAALLLTACLGIALLKKSMELTSEITGGVMTDTGGVVKGAASDTMIAAKGIGLASRALSGGSAMSALKQTSSAASQIKKGIN